MAKKPVILVADGMNLMYRGFYAIEGFKCKDPDYKPNYMMAVAGMSAILVKDMQTIDATHCVVVFDAPGGNFRVKLYPEYKANRAGGLPLHGKITRRARKFLYSAGIKSFCINGEEGDDLIGSLAVTLSQFGKVYISSNDKDFAALVNRRIHLLHPRQEILDADDVKTKFGVRPDQIIEYLMLVGDTVDNIPGVPKVAGKTAARLLTEFESLSNILKETHTPVLTRNLRAAKRQFKLTRKLVTIKTDCLPNVTLQDARLRGLSDRFAEYCKRYGFHRERKTFERFYS